MPVRCTVGVPDGRAYNEAAAEKAWGRMLELFKASL
jgi:carboxymethylenebutenolidase